MDAVADEPGGEFAPLVGAATVDGQAGLSVLVLGLHQVCAHLLQSQERGPRPGIPTGKSGLWGLGQDMGAEKNGGNVRGREPSRLRSQGTELRRMNLSGGKRLIRHYEV